MIRLAAVALLVVFSFTPRASAQSCQGSPVAVQILGSGGPELNRDRSSASYLVWIDGEAKILVDAGGESFLRFGQAEARVADLSLIAISHLHPDHVSDLPALLWSPDAPRKERPPVIAGPSGNDAAPGLSTFLSRLFNQETGAFQVLSGWAGGPGRGIPLEVVMIDGTKREPSTVLSRQDIAVTALGVPHGNILTLAFRVQTRNKTIVFSGDQNGSDSRFVEFARGADVLVMHLTNPGPDSDSLHASPGVVGQIARDAHVGRLVLGHIGRFDPLEPAIAVVKKYYPGPLTVGADLLCVPVPVDRTTSIQPARILTSVPGSDPSVSPDGRNVVFSRRLAGSPDAKAQLWTVPFRGGDAHRLTPDDFAYDATRPSWSPDGKTIAFRASRQIDASPRGGIWVMSASGGGLRPVIDDAVNDYYPRWFPDGRRMVINRDVPRKETDVWMIDLDSRTAQQLTSNPAYDGASTISPDGARIAFPSDRQGQRNIWIMALAEGEAGIRQFTVDGGRGPAWSPDGRWITYGCPVTPQLYALCLKGLAGGSVIQVTDGKGNDFNPSWAPDGKSVVVSQRSGLAVIDVASVVR